MVESVNGVSQADYGKIYEGMSVNDANNNATLMNIFNFADLDGDGTISKVEFERYNAPIYTENDKGEVSFITKNFCPKHGIPKDNINLYAGLELKDVPQKSRVTYTLADLNHDNKLSKEEMEKLEEAYNRTKNIDLDKATANGNYIAKMLGGFLISMPCGLKLVKNIVDLIDAKFDPKFFINTRMTDAKSAIKPLLKGSILPLIGLIGGLYLVYDTCKQKRDDKNRIKEELEQFHPYIKHKAEAA